MLHDGQSLIHRQIRRMRNLLARLHDGLLTCIDNAFHVRQDGTCQPECWCQVAERFAAYFNDGTAMADRYTLEMQTYDAREHVVAASLSLQSSRIHSDLHPENPYGGAEIELHEDILWDAVKDYYLSKIVLDTTP